MILFSLYVLCMREYWFFFYEIIKLIISFYCEFLVVLGEFKYKKCCISKIIMFLVIEVSG